MELMDVAIISSGIATGFAGLISGFNSNKGSAEVSNENSSHLENRLSELKNYLAKQESVAFWNKISGGLLTAGQFIIGGLLTSSFMQENLSSSALGSLGLFVLLSSLIYKAFRPDLKSSAARNRATSLKNTLRLAHDKYNTIKLENSGNSKQLAFAENELASDISAQIAKIEAVEHQDLLNSSKVISKATATES
jgi:hypothetical protein